jgi:hypothetical protein
MTRSTFFAVTFGVIFCAGYMNSSANAGWFGPSSYDECVVENMKGQAVYMMPTVRNVCSEKFPSPPPKPPKPAVVRLNTSLIKYHLCSTETENEFKICIDYIPSNYRITYVDAMLSNNDNCTPVEPPSWIDKYTGKLSQYQYDEMLNAYNLDAKKWTSLRGRKAWYFDDYSFTKTAHHDCVVFEFFGFID